MKADYDLSEGKKKITFSFSMPQIIGLDEILIDLFICCIYEIESMIIYSNFFNEIL